MGKIRCFGPVPRQLVLAILIYGIIKPPMLNRFVNNFVKIALSSEK